MSDVEAVVLTKEDMKKFVETYSGKPEELFQVCVEESIPLGLSEKAFVSLTITERVDRCYDAYVTLRGLDREEDSEVEEAPVSIGTAPPSVEAGRAAMEEEVEEEPTPTGAKEPEPTPEPTPEPEPEPEPVVAQQEDSGPLENPFPDDDPKSVVFNLLVSGLERKGSSSVVNEALLAAGYESSKPKAISRTSATITSLRKNLGYIVDYEDRDGVEYFKLIGPRPEGV